LYDIFTGFNGYFDDNIITGFRDFEWDFMGDLALKIKGWFYHPRYSWRKHVQRNKLSIWLFDIAMENPLKWRF